MTAQLTSWVPGAAWAKHAGAHLRWRLRQSRADRADRSGRRFRYVHPIVGCFVYHPSDYLSRRLFLHDDFERQELRFAMDRARAGGTILDVGANIGLYTVACARAAGARGRVIAIEPGPATFEKLSQTCAALRLSNVTPLRAAAGRRNGKADLVSRRSGRDVHQHLADAREHEASDRVSVEIRRLDDICGAEVEQVTLMKLDVEGHELAAVDGAERILTTASVHLIVEFNPGALVAAGASGDQLWRRLARTHDCTTVIGEDGRTLTPSAASITTGRMNDVFNTIWAPRQ
jgi:FkbM family methyltransferase